MIHVTGAMCTGELAIKQLDYEILRSYMWRRTGALEKSLHDSRKETAAVQVERDRLSKLLNTIMFCVSASVHAIRCT